MRQLRITQQITSRESIAVNKYLQDISSIPLLTAEEELSLPAKIKEGDTKALNRFVEGNLRFVISVAKQYQSSGESLDDLINAGNEGLITAALRFDTSRGFKFISYAVWWIRQTIMQHLNENSKSIRLPLNKITIANKLKVVTAKLEQDLNRLPTLDELKEGLTEKYPKLKLEPGEIEKVLTASSPVSSLDLKLGDDTESTLIDILTFKGLEDVNDTLQYQDLKTTLKKVLKKRLSPREFDVIVMHYGLFGEPQKTLEEIGFKIDLTRERVRQIREKSLRKLKQMSSAREIREYI